MKKIINILIITLVLSQTTFSQTVKVDYIEKKNIPLEKLAQLPPQIVQILNKEAKCTLVHSQGKSLFRFQDDNTGNLEMNISVPKREEYYKNIVNRDLLRLAFVSDEKFLVTDIFPIIQWKIENETQKIGEYNCQKATAMYKATELVAWFCGDIAISDGPLMLNGLPGLIIKASINNMLTYSATKITIEKENMVISSFIEGKPITAVNFEKLKAKISEETLARQKEAGATHLNIK